MKLPLAQHPLAPLPYARVFAGMPASLSHPPAKLKIYLIRVLEGARRLSQQNNPNNNIRAPRLLMMMLQPRKCLCFF